MCPRAFNQRVVLREHIRSHHSGPDTKNGTTASPFYCTVCGDSLVTSVLLIQHLIEHSDMNTAMKRQPPVSEIYFLIQERPNSMWLYPLRRLVRANTSDDEN